MRRSAFTLVELLVVIIIILVVAALVVAFAPRLAQRQKVPRGADLLQGWLLQAKQRAKRDQLPTGLRLFPDANGLVTTLQFIQKPDDFSGNWIGVREGDQASVWGESQRLLIWWTYHNGTAKQHSRVETITPADFSNGGSDPSLWPVQAGDYVEIKGGGLVRQIVRVATNKLTLVSAFPYLIEPTTEYRVIRAPRPLLGEANLNLPKDVVIDLKTNATYKNAITNNGSVAVDLLFGTGGALLDQVGSDSFLALWVRNAIADPSTDLPAEFSLEPIVVVIYKTTGLIASHPINPSKTDPYLFAKDGRSSGL